MADHGRALSELCQAVAAQSGVLLLADADGALQPMAFFGRPPGAAASANPLGRIFRREGDTDRHLIVPVPDTNGGVLVLERVGREDFSRDDLALARLYARQMAGSLVVGAAPAGSTWTRQLEAVQRLGGQLARLSSVEEVGSGLCDDLRAVIAYDEAHLYVAGEGAADTSSPAPPLRLVGMAGAPLDSHGVPVPIAPEGVAGHAISRAATSRAPVSVPQVADGAPARPGSWSLVAVPLRIDDRVNGVLCLLARSPRRFTDDDVRVLQVVAEQTAVAIENARLLSARGDLVVELAALLEISQASTNGADEVSLARTVAAKIRDASRMDACIVSRWDENSTVLVTLAQDGFDGPTGSTDIADFPATWAVLRHARPRVVQTDEGADAMAEAGALTEMGGRTLLMLPLAVGGRAIGLVELISVRRRQFSADEMSVLQTMVSTAATGLENARLLEQLRRAADIDQLTGVHNHRYLQDRLRQEVARAARNRSPLSVMMLDLDDFKPINDQYGHAEGDRVLRNVGTALRAAVRANDIVARYGGDEFVVVMPDTPADRAQEVARRVIVGIRERHHELSDGTTARIGVSGGLAVYPENGRSAELLLNEADTAMYAAKRARPGRSDRIPAPAPEPLMVNPALPAPLPAPSAG